MYSEADRRSTLALLLVLEGMDTVVHFKPWTLIKIITINIVIFDPETVCRCHTSFYGDGHISNKLWTRYN